MNARLWQKYYTSIKTRQISVAYFPERITDIAFKLYVWFQKVSVLTNCMHYHDLPYLLILQWIRRLCSECKKWRAHSRAIRQPPCADWMRELFAVLEDRARSLHPLLFWLTDSTRGGDEFWSIPVTRIFLISWKERMSSSRCVRSWRFRTPLNPFTKTIQLVGWFSGSFQQVKYLLQCWRVVFF